jgi:hypothetical protein
MVDSAYSEWLQLPERLASGDDPVIINRWGELALTSVVSSALDEESAAIAEAGRQLAFKGGPLVEEEVTIPKLIDIASVRGRVRTIRIASDPAYAAGLDVFVLGGELLHATGVTKLFVLRRL